MFPFPNLAVVLALQVGHSFLQSNSLGAKLRPPEEVSFFFLVFQQFGKKVLGIPEFFIMQCDLISKHF